MFSNGFPKEWSTLRKLVWLYRTVINAVSAVLKTVTGNPIHILDALAKPVQSLSVKLEPIQDLHGYDNPWPAGGGKNKLNISAITPSKTENGVTFTVNADGSVTLSGTATAQSQIVWRIPNVTAKTFSGMILDCFDTTPSGFFAVMEEAGGSYTSFALNNSSSGTIINSSIESTDRDVNLIIRVSNGTALGTKTAYPMIRPSGTETGYAPYSNICPISGRTGAKVTRTGKNLLEMPFEYYTATASKDNCFPLPSGTYTFSFDSTTETSWRFVLRLYDADGNEITSGTPAGISMPYRESVHGFSNGVNTAIKYFQFTLESDAYVRVLFWGGSTSASSTFTKAQLELGSTATAYEEYRGTTYPIPLGTTVYGGTLDVTSGVLTVDRAMWTKNTADMNNTNDTPGWRNSGIKDLIGSGINREFGNQIMNIGEFWSANTNGSNDILFLRTARYNKTQDEWKTLAIDVQIVAELATPFELTLTPEEITLLEGENNLWSDAGDMTLTYLADGNASDVEALNILLGGRYVNNHGEDEPTDREALDILLGNTR